ncbi:MAG: hypothetical protein ACI4MH_05400 [Candidatus Coproplasma sp.]
MSKKKLSVLLFALFFFAAMIFTVDYVAVNAQHDCVGDGCSVCAVLQLADNIGDDHAFVPSETSVRYARAEELVTFACDLSVAVASPVSRRDILII